MSWFVKPARSENIGGIISTDPILGQGLNGTSSDIRDAITGFNQIETQRIHHVCLTALRAFVHIPMIFSKQGIQKRFHCSRNGTRILNLGQEERERGRAKRDDIYFLLGSFFRQSEMFARQKKTGEKGALRKIKSFRSVPDSVPCRSKLPARILQAIQV